jgi:hypothetical protein
MRFELTFKNSTPEVPNEFWDDFMKEVKAETLIELNIPVYENTIQMRRLFS